MAAEITKMTLTSYVNFYQVYTVRAHSDQDDVTGDSEDLLGAGAEVTCPLYDTAVPAR